MSTLAHWRDTSGQREWGRRVWGVGCPFTSEHVLPSSGNPMRLAGRGTQTQFLKHNMTQLLIQEPIEGIKRKFEKRNCAGPGS